MNLRFTCTFCRNPSTIEPRSVALGNDRWRPVRSRRVEVALTLSVRQRTRAYETDNAREEKLLGIQQIGEVPDLGLTPERTERPSGIVLSNVGHSAMESFGRSRRPRSNASHNVQWLGEPNSYTVAQCSPTMSCPRA
jgi:hypothetical protein